VLACGIVGFSGIHQQFAQWGTFAGGEPYLMTWPFERDEAQEISVRPFKNLTDS
jgi:hypothetical protein